MVLKYVDEIAKLFPSLFGQPSAVLQPSESNDPASALKIGVVLSGGQAPGGHNVISGMFGKRLLSLFSILYVYIYFVRCRLLAGTVQGKYFIWI